MSAAGSSVSPTSSMKRFELGKLKLRVPTCTECRALTRGSSSARRIPLDWLKRPWAGDSSRRSRWASRCTMPTLPATASWTPATAGNRIESSPPTTAGTSPAAATSRVFARTAASVATMSWGTTAASPASISCSGRQGTTRSWSTQ